MAKAVKEVGVAESVKVKPQRSSAQYVSTLPRSREPVETVLQGLKGFDRGRSRGCHQLAAVKLALEGLLGFGYGLPAAASAGGYADAKNGTAKVARVGER